MTTTSTQLRGMRYRLGGRGLDGTIDCYGVTLAKAAEQGRPLGDVWQQVCRQWRTGGELAYAHGFPAGWRRLHGDELLRARTMPQNGDVWVMHTAHPGVGIIDGGRFWTATPEAGVVSLDPMRAAVPSEVWRQ